MNYNFYTKRIRYFYDLNGYQNYRTGNLLRTYHQTDGSHDKGLKSHILNQTGIKTLWYVRNCKLIFALTEAILSKKISVCDNAFLLRSISQSSTTRVNYKSLRVLDLVSVHFINDLDCLLCISSRNPKCLENFYQSEGMLCILT